MKKFVSFQSTLALNCVIFLLSGIQAGIGPFLVIYLSAQLHWNPYQIGIVVGTVHFANMLSQIPSGLLIDAYKIKRLMLMCSCLLFAICCFLIVHFPYFSVIISAQFFIGLAIAIIPQAIIAITLGLVGTTEFPQRASINETLSHAGNMILVLIAGISSYFIENTWIIYTYAIFSLLGLLPIFLIQEKEINHDLARQLAPVFSSQQEKVISITKILKSAPTIIFLISIFLFHLSSAAQLTLIGLLFVQLNTKTDAIFMANSIIMSHLIMMFVSIALVFYIKRMNRKPLFILAFVFIFIRAILLTFSHNPYFIIGLQILDGISGGIIGVIGIVMLSELVANSGRFNFMHGCMVLCQGLAYAMSNVISGYMAKSYGYDASFYTLATIAMLGFILFLFFMPETFAKKFL